MMNLDFYTIVFFTVLNSLFIVLLITFFLLTSKKRYWFLNLLIAGLLFLCFGILIVGLKGKISETVSLLSGNSFLILGFAMLSFSVISYKGEFRKKTFFAFLIMYVLYFIMFLFIHRTEYTTRVAFISFWIFFYFFYGSVHLMKHRTKKSFFAPFIGALLLAYAIGFLYRGLYAVFLSEEFIINDHQLQIVYYGLGNLLIILGSVGLLLLIKERDENIIEKDNSLLRESNQSKVKLFSIISHDLKGPIGYIKPLAEILEKKCADYQFDKANELIGTIKETSENAFTLLENILDWSKNQFENFQIKPVNFKLKNAVKEILSIFYTGAKEKGVEITCSKDCGKEVHADPDVIKVVLRNLVSNALKFTNKGGKISIDSYEEDNGYVTIEIKDTGVGIEKDKIPDIFKMNTNKTTAGTSGEIGTGLGLTLSAELIKKNKGTISLESEVNVGTKIKITLPSKEQ